LQPQNQNNQAPNPILGQTEQEKNQYFWIIKHRTHIPNLFHCQSQTREIHRIPQKHQITQDHSKENKKPKTPTKFPTFIQINTKPSISQQPKISAARMQIRTVERNKLFHFPTSSSPEETSRTHQQIHPRFSTQTSKQKSSQKNKKQEKITPFLYPFSGE